MISEATALLPLSMVLSAGVGFLAGETCGNCFRRRKRLEQINADLRSQIAEKARASQEPPCRELKRLRGEINDIHKHVLAVSKGLEKYPSQPQ